MGRWDNDRRSDDDVLVEFRCLQMRMLHHKDKRKEALGRYEVEKIDLEIKESYQELRELYERNYMRIQNLMCSNKAKGFERFAWYLMLSDETQKRFR